jgi:hypothetical protein
VHTTAHIVADIMSADRLDADTELDLDLDADLDAGGAIADDTPTVPLTADELGTDIVLADRLDDDPFTASDRRVSSAVEACIRRFAVAEADVTTPDVDGLGRVSGVRHPRLGGVLNGRVEPGSAAADALRSAVERTIRAGYLTALSARQVASRPIVHEDVDELWEAFVPNSYRIPRKVAATVWEVCRFDDFWSGVLEDLGLDGDAARFANGHVSDISRSIRGLSTVGMMLALVERGGRHDRLQRGRTRSDRPHRSVRRDLPRAPRPYGA